MNKHSETLETMADQLAAEALQELGSAPLDELDELDEYAEQCDYAGCYPWLAEVICAHPHDNVINTVLHGEEAAEDDINYSC